MISSEDEVHNDNTSRVELSLLGQNKCGGMRVVMRASRIRTLSVGRC